MRLTVFLDNVLGGGDTPDVDLPNVRVSLSATDDAVPRFNMHGLTPAHARQLIEMLTPIAAIVEHKLKVEAEGRHVRFKCSCNLLGLLRDTQGEALEDFKAHVAEKAVTA